MNFALNGALKRIKNGCKIIGTAEQKRRIDMLITGANPFDLFVSRHVKPDPDHAVMTETMVLQYRQFYDRMAWRQQSDRMVQCGLQEAMRRIHGIAKSKDLQGADKRYRRGYRHCTLLPLARNSE